ncbi:MAG: hypothetical protein V8R27_02070 [Oscillospiraceae bacterium]
MNSLFPISSPSVIYRELAACAPILEKFGMALSLPRPPRWRNSSPPPCGAAGAST